jgi:hypothetical protein
MTRNGKKGKKEKRGQARIILPTPNIITAILLDLNSLQVHYLFFLLVYLLVLVRAFVPK